MKREDFPLLKTTTFLDSWAGTLKPIPVIQEIINYYKDYPINTHSINSKLGSIVYSKVQKTRKLVSNLVDCDTKEIVFTSGTTDGINKISRTLDIFFKKNDEIVISEYNHSSNAVPWLQLAKRVGAKLIISKNLLDDINEKTKLVAYAQINNSLFQKNSIEKIYKKVKKFGGILVNDAAQAIICEKVTIKNSDIIVFSGTKLYGPTGVGALIIKKDLMEKLSPEIVGGGSVNFFNEKFFRLKKGFYGFEAGTPHVAGIIAMGTAIEYMNKNENFEHKKNLVKYAYDKLNEIENIEIISQKTDYNVLFKVKGIPCQDVTSYLGYRDIILRSGKQCALYLFDNNEIEEVIRMSFGLYNKKEDIDKAIKEIKNGGDFIDVV